MDERHIASVVVTEDSYSKHDPSRLTSMFVKPEESSTDPVDPKYVASVFVTENSVGYENINRNLTTDHQYAQIGENERDKSNHQRDQRKERPLKEKRNIREKKHKTVKTRTLVVSVIIAVIIGVLIGVFGVLAVQYFSNDSKSNYTCSLFNFEIFTNNVLKNLLSYSLFLVHIYIISSGVKKLTK